MGGFDPDSLLLRTRVRGRVIVKHVEHLRRTKDRMEQLRSLSAALASASDYTAGLRDARDALIAEVAAEGTFGFARIGEAAGVTATYASRKARDAGVPPRHIREAKPGR